MSIYTPEFTVGKKKFFPTESSVSGKSPEFTVGGKQTYPGSVSVLKTGSLAITPESTVGGKQQFPLEASLNT